MPSVQPRLNRLFAFDGACFDVAIDHGFFNEYSFLAGIENLPAALTTIIDAAPDAIQLSVGQAHHLQARMSRKPALVLRTDVANVYGTPLPHTLFSQLISEPVEQAVRWDAACVVVNLLLLPGQPELHHACVQNITALKPLCERSGMPLMIEPLVMQPNDRAGGYMVDGDITKILPLVRQAVELGADVIKADPTDDPSEYYRVIEIASGVPVLVRGGGRAPDTEILTRTSHVMAQGASGIVYGRNVVQHANPRGMIRALMAIVHEKSTSEQAARLMEEDD